MSDVCDALTDLANRMRQLSPQDKADVLRLSSKSQVSDDDPIFCGVDELEFKLRGAAMELLRLRDQISRLMDWRDAG